MTPARTTILEAEAHARHRRLLPVANTCVLLSGMLLVTVAMFTWVIYKNAKERASRESVGAYHETTFRVGTTSWRRQRPAIGSFQGSGTTYAQALGTVDQKNETLDLLPFFAMRPTSQAQLDSAFPRGAEVRVYYNPDASIGDRVVFWSAKPPVTMAAREASIAAKIGSVTAAGLAILLWLSILFRKYCIGPQLPGGTSAS
jgi:hypothetical protein